MKELFKNMQAFEAVLFIFGTVIALAIVIAFVLSLFGILKNKINATTITALLVSIIMIAFPSIQSFSYGSLKVEMAEKTSAINSNPDDTLSRSSLEEIINKIRSNSKYKDDPSTKNIVANALLALGDYEAARQTINEVAETHPEEINKQLKDSIDTKAAEQDKFNSDVSTINQLLQHFELSRAEDKDGLAKTISMKVTELPHVRYVDKSAAIVISNALKVSGNHEQSVAIEEKAANPVSSSVISEVMHKETAIAPQIISHEALTNFQKPQADSQKVNIWARQFHPVVRTYMAK